MFCEDIKPVPQKRTASNRNPDDADDQDDDEDDHEDYMADDTGIKQEQGQAQEDEEQEEEDGEDNAGQTNLHTHLGNRRRMMLFCDSCHMRGMQRYSEVLAWFRDPKVPAHLRLAGS
jgi:hypothetical protein